MVINIPEGLAQKIGDKHLRKAAEADLDAPKQAAWGDPQQTLDALVKEVLKPGGTLLFYEHVLSPREDVAWWQRFWAPLWVHIMDGCRIDRPTHVWIEKMDVWAEGRVWGKADEPEEHLFWHRVGRFVKKQI